MQLHELKQKTKMRTSRRIGRGGKRGTTSGRGTKGQKARAGAKIRPALRDIIKKLPKQRGYRFHSFRPQPAVVSLAAIAEKFSSGETVDPAALLSRALIRRIKGSTPAVKVLGNAPVKKKLSFRNLALSKSARARVIAAGGKILSSAASPRVMRGEV